MTKGFPSSVGDFVREILEMVSCIDVEVIFTVIKDSTIFSRNRYGTSQFALIISRAIGIILGSRRWSKPHTNLSRRFVTVP